MSMSLRTEFASVSYTDAAGSHVHLYYVGGSNIYEVVCDNGNKGEPKPILPGTGTARLNTALAAIQWESGKRIRVYYFDVKNNLKEICFNEGRNNNQWFDGDLNRSNIIGGETSSVTAVYSDVDSNPPIHEVYYQAADGRVYITTHRAGTTVWSKPAQIFELIPWGACITAVYVPGFGRRMYTNNDLGNIMEVKNEGNSWVYTGPVSNARNHEIGTEITVTTNKTTIYVLVVTSEGFLEGYEWKMSTSVGWKPISMDKTPVFYLSSVTGEVLEDRGFAAFQAPNGDLQLGNFNLA